MKDLIPLLLGASISFLSVLFTLRHNQKLHEDALRKERDKTKEEREFIAKQDALLGASEAICRFLDYYVRIPNLTLAGDGKSIPEVANLGITLNKLHFYCSLPTIRSATKFGQIINSAHSAVLTSKMAAEIERGNIQGIDIRIQGLEKTAASIGEEIKVLLSSDPDSSMIIYHREQLAKVHGDSAEFWRQRSEVFLKQMQLTEQCRDVMASHLAQIYEALRDILILARDELSFDIEKEEYLKLMEDSTQEVLGEMHRMFDTVRSQVGNAVTANEA